MSGALRLVRDDDPGDPPAVDLLDLWRQYMAAYGCSLSTIRGRMANMEALLRRAGVTDARKLTRDHVIGWLGRDLSPWSRLTYWKMVQKFSEWMREFGHDPECDLTHGIPKPPTPEPVARPINDETIERMLALNLAGRSHAYIRLALYQALRVHEIAKIRGADFDLAAGWLLVTGKGNITKPIPIHPEVRKLCDVMPEIGYSFPSSTNPLQPVASNAVSITITNALRQCGSTATAHQLRDTAATRMQRTRRDIRLTQAMLRHRDIKSTMKYTEASNAELQDAVAGMRWRDQAQEQAVPALTWRR